MVMTSYNSDTSIVKPNKSCLPEVRLNFGRTTGLEILKVIQGNIWKLKIKLSRPSCLNTNTLI